MGTTGSHLIATVNCHSSFLLPCCPPPWTNIPPRQFRREPASQLSSSHSQIRSSIVQIPTLPPSSLNQFSKPTLLTSHRAGLTPALSQPRPDITFHLRHSILPLSTSFAPRPRAVPHFQLLLGCSYKTQRFNLPQAKTERHKFCQRSRMLLVNSSLGLKSIQFRSLV